ncbi:MAG: DMT family transporter [Erysipelotrichaceae bacterium]
MNKRTKGIICLFLVAVTFGFGYGFQAMAENVIAPFSFLSWRYFIASLFFLPFMFKKDGTSFKTCLEIMIVLGLILSLASGFQQMAAGRIHAGKIGFITSLYIVMVPLIESVLFKKRINSLTLMSIIICLIGLFFLCGVRDFSFGFYEFIVLCSAFLYALEIIYIDHKASGVNTYKFTFSLCFGTFVFCLVFSIFEGSELLNIKNALVPVLYMGIVAGALGYYFQSKGQSLTPGTMASLIMALESVFSMIGGFVLLNQIPSVSEIVGAVIMFAGVVLCIISSDKF